MRRPRRGAPLAGERGEGIVSALLLLAGAILPLCFLLALVGRVEQASLAAVQAATTAVRAAALAPTPQAAQADAEAELAAAQRETAAGLELRLDGSFARGGVLVAQVSATVPVGELPFLGEVGTITLAERAAAPVDLYRALPGAP